MSSSSSSSPEISPATRTDSPHERYATQADVLEDLQSRFILNLPEEELSSLERVCFQVEQAHWFYEDFVREENSKFPSLPLKKFVAMIFNSCPSLQQWRNMHEEAFTNFMQYKTRVPVCGAIMLNDSWDKCVLVKGWKSSSGWGFPKGKINEDESQSACAVREVLEETGYNLAGKINPEDVIEMSIKEQKIALYIVAGVPEDFPFKTKTRKEISKIEWFKLTDLPTWKRNKTPAGKFYLITPFISQLKAFVHDRKPSNIPRKSSKPKRQPQRAQFIDTTPNGNDSAVTDSPSTPYQDSHQESSSQSSSADNGDPQTPSPQFSQSLAVDVVSTTEPTINNPDIERLISSLRLSGEAKKHQLFPSISSHANVQRERSTPVPWESPLRSNLPNPLPRTNPSSKPGLSSTISVSGLHSPSLPVVTEPSSPIPSQQTGRPHHPNMSPMSSRPLASRRTSSVADISPYLTRPTELPLTSTQLKQYSLLQSIADESARMTPSIPSLPLASNPNGMVEPNIIYSSNPIFTPQRTNIPAIPLHSLVQDDPFQIRPRTSQAIHRPSAYHSSPSMSLNQGQLLSVMHNSGPPPSFPRQPLPSQPPFTSHIPMNYSGLPPPSPFVSPSHHVPNGAYPPSPMQHISFSAVPPPGLISSPYPAIPPTPSFPIGYGQASGPHSNVNHLLAILNPK